MKQYTTKASLHPILGEHVEVVDTQTNRAVTLFTGDYAQQRADADARCRELTHVAENQID